MIKLIDLLEARSEASAEAKKLGLTYYGFGGYGKDGVVTHRSVGGKLHAKVTPTPVSDDRLKAQYGDEEQRTGEEGDDLPPHKIPDEAPRDDYDDPGEEPTDAKAAFVKHMLSIDPSHKEYHSVDEINRRMVELLDELDQLEREMGDLDYDESDASYRELEEKKHEIAGELNDLHSTKAKLKKSTR